VTYLDMNWHPWYDIYSTHHNVTTMALSFTPIAPRDVYTEYVYVNDNTLVGEIVLADERYELRSVDITFEEDQRNVEVKTIASYDTLEEAHTAAEEKLQ